LGWWDNSNSWGWCWGIIGDWFRLWGIIITLWNRGILNCWFWRKITRKKVASRVWIVVGTDGTKGGTIACNLGPCNSKSIKESGLGVGKVLDNIDKRGRIGKFTNLSLQSHITI
jgi:hypothetical protein